MFVEDLTRLESVRRQLLNHNGCLSRGELGEYVRDLEIEVEADLTEAFSFDDPESALLKTSLGTFRAGRFTTPSLRELRDAVPSGARSARSRLSLLIGGHDLFDIGTLQAGARPGALFQAASQFNCLEAPGARIVPIRYYLGDSTQGPRASISALPGTFLRHYAAPGFNGRFTQTDTRDINLLKDVLDPDVARVQSGYLRGSGIHSGPEALAQLNENFDKIRVGAHDNVDVLFGSQWSGPVPKSNPGIGQVFTSTIALGGYSFGSSDLEGLCKPLLRAAYLGTLLSAIQMKRRTVFLTLIGGGVFGNPLIEIWNAILWALNETDELISEPLDVILNMYGGIGRLSPEDVHDEVKDREGTIIEADRGRFIVY
ncbi:MAG: hypothetical protein P1V97_12995 [Planctomycetota bacterium]|nr:hypothetical protein [Planctomycetota bacterium]